MPDEEIEKKISFCTVENGETESQLAFKFGNGTVVSIDLNELSEDISGQLLVHGLTQKGRDSFASAKGDFTFAIAQLEKTFDHLRDGQWNASRASGGDGTPRISELAEAIANIKKLDLATVQTAVAGAEDEQRKAWRKNPSVAAEILRIRAKKAQDRADKAAKEGTDAPIAGF